MRIGLIAPPWIPVPPTAYGGTESVIDRLARGFARAGHDVLLGAAANSSCPVRLVPGTDEAADGALAEGCATTEVRHVVTSYAAMADVDVVHDHTMCGPVYRHHPLGVPVVTTNHGPFDKTLNPIYRALRDVPIIAISRSQASAADGVRIAAVIHHGIDVDAVPEGPGRSGFASFIGRMSPDKGLREAVLIARAAGVPLRIAAKCREAAEQEYFEAEVKPLLGDDVEYLGELGETDKLKLVGDSFALLNPMQWPEPFGLVMIEALAAGTPVVATPAGSAPEIVDDGITGYLRKDRRALAEALVAAAGLDRTACRAAAMARFDTERMVREHVQLYTDLIGSDRGTARLRAVDHPASRKGMVLRPAGHAAQLDA
jgi:glycosyltransferase involved in cell wall biosynthesis